MIMGQAALEQGADAGVGAQQVQGELGVARARSRCRPAS